VAAVTPRAAGLTAICEGEGFAALHRSFQSGEGFYIVFSERLQTWYNMPEAVRDQVETMQQKRNAGDHGKQGAEDPSLPGSDTERFRAIIDVKHNEAITGESGVPRKQRDHELRCQERSLDEFS